jgi:hypothetical protein
MFSTVLIFVAGVVFAAFFPKATQWAHDKAVATFTALKSLFAKKQ